MGTLLNNANVRIAMLGLKEDVAVRVKDTIDQLNNPKVLKLYELSRTEEVRSDIGQQKMTSLFIDIFSLGIAPAMKLIGEMRGNEKMRYVAICLVGTTKELEDMKDVPKDWVKRFKHYYQFKTDLNDPQTEKDHLDKIVDCFVADQVKFKVLGDYVHTPGVFFTLLHKTRRFFEKESVQSSIVAAIIAGVFLLVNEALRPPCP